MNLTFVTGNKYKFADAEILFEGSGIELIQESLDLPEIQSEDAEEIARYTAEEAGKLLQKPLFVLDRALHIDALKGFPGPFAKQINRWLTAEQTLSLIGENRGAHWTSAIGYFSPGAGVKTFVGKTEGRIAETPAPGESYMLDQIFIPDGYNVPFSELGDGVVTKIQNECSCWRELIEFLNK